MNDSSNRRVTCLRYSTEINWQKSLPATDWLLLLYEDNAKSSYIDEAISKTINNSVAYVCTTGNRAEEIHDLLDEEIAYRRAGNDFQPDSYHLPKHLILTTWHTDLREGIEFAINLAEHGSLPINEVICSDISAGAYFKEQVQKQRKQ